MKKLLLIIILCLLSSASFAEDFYIGATGSTTITDCQSSCSSTCSYTVFNTAGNWGAGDGKISGGDTVHICGTLTGTAGTNLLTFQGSGTAGNVITLKFEAGAILTATYWGVDANAAIYASGKDYITIDGGTNGIIRATANGTSLANQQDNQGIQLYNSSHVTVQNLTISDMYVRVSGTEQNDYGTGIYINCSGNAVHSVTITANIINDALQGIATKFCAGSQDYEISYNTISNVNWGGAVSHGENSSTITNLNIHHNTISGWGNWDDTSASNSFHHNGWIGWAMNGSTIQGNFYSNTIGPGFTAKNTSGTYWNSDDVNAPSGASIDMLYYNNLFQIATGETLADGFIYILYADGATGTTQIYNNTFACVDNNIYSIYLGGGPAGSAHTVKNNIGYECLAIFRGYVDGETFVSDYNIWHTSAAEPFCLGATSSCGYHDLAGWRGHGFDTTLSTETISADPLFVSASDYRLQSGSPAKDSGTTIASFSTDKNGISRPQGSAWDIGAYEYDPGKKINIGAGGTITFGSGGTITLGN